VEILAKRLTVICLGPRACIGRKFAATESVCVLTLMLRDWNVEPLLNPGETHEEWAVRVLQARLRLTLGVTTVPVKFVKRKVRDSWPEFTHCFC
jgi:hypothetical protein